MTLVELQQAIEVLRRRLPEDDLISAVMRMRKERYDDFDDRALSDLRE